MEVQVGDKVMYHNPFLDKECEALVTRIRSEEMIDLNVELPNYDIIVVTASLRDEDKKYKYGWRVKNELD